MNATDDSNQIYPNMLRKSLFPTVVETKKQTPAPAAFFIYVTSSVHSKPFRFEQHKLHAECHGQTERPLDVAK